MDKLIGTTAVVPKYFKNFHHIEPMPLDNLFGQVSEVDEKVDALFGQSTGPVLRPVKERTVLPVKEKQEKDKKHNKKTARESKEKSKKVKVESSIEKSSDSDDIEELDSEEAKEMDSEEAKQLDTEALPKKQSRKRKRSDDNEDLELEYYQKRHEEEAPESESESESEEKPAEVAKEPVKLDLKEKELEKADRTVFVGNVTKNVLTNNKTKKALRKFFTQFGKVESIRFRLIAFAEQIPKKAAFITKKFHDSRDTVNAYVVFEKTESVAKAIEKNGFVFETHHLRIDSVSHPEKKDNRRSVFIGNLDFAEVEELLWKHFEKCGQIEYVRIVRDSKTNVGKGIAYVQFVEPVSVEKALLLDGKPMDSAVSKKPRSLRVARCKRSENDKKAMMNARNSDKLAQLNSKQKTKAGRAISVLGKLDRAQVGRVIIEGARAQEGKGVTVKNGKIRKPKVKKPRYTERSKRFKKEKLEDQKKNVKKL